MLIPGYFDTVTFLKTLVIRSWRLKTQRLEAEGKSSFMEITIPKAVIRFRQGIGRLIRSHTDVGDLLILDSRILNKRYGAHFFIGIAKRRL